MQGMGVPTLEAIWALPIEQEAVALNDELGAKVCNGVE
jgi:hypothetical protein